MSAYYAASSTLRGYVERPSWIDLFTWGLDILAALCIPLAPLRTSSHPSPAAFVAPICIEHCRIKSVSGATISVVIIGVLAVIIAYGDRLFYERWSDRSQAPIILGTILFTLAFLFLLWSLYVLLRFALAFHLAARNLRRQWKSADRSVAAQT